MMCLERQPAARGGTSARSRLLLGPHTATAILQPQAPIPSRQVGGPHLELPALQACHRLDHTLHNVPLHRWDCTGGENVNTRGHVLVPGKLLQREVRHTTDKATRTRQPPIPSISAGLPTIHPARDPSPPRPSPTFILLNRSRQRPSMLAYVRLSITSFRSVNVLRRGAQNRTNERMCVPRSRARQACRPSAAVLTGEAIEPTGKYLPLQPLRYMQDADQPRNPWRVALAWPGSARS